jgi:hypothetical protein
VLNAFDCLKWATLEEDAMLLLEKSRGRLAGHTQRQKKNDFAWFFKAK